MHKSQVASREQLNEAVDTLAAAAAELNPSGHLNHHHLAGSGIWTLRQFTSS